MATFKLNAPLTQTDPQVKVDVSRTDPLPIGPNRFRLTVIDDAGNESQPVFLDVVVKDKDNPTAVLDLVNADGRIINPPEVPFGTSFVLSGARSSDVPPGKVAQYKFTLVGPT